MIRRSSNSRWRRRLSWAAVVLLNGISSAPAQDADNREAWKLPAWWFQTPGQQDEGAVEAWMSDPFGTISGDMLAASRDLHVAQTQPPVEVTQPRVEQRLEKLIKLLEKQCKAGSGAGAGSPTRPATASNLRTGQDRTGPLQDPEDSSRKWAKLSPKQREKIQQATTEGFPPGYEDVLADYFLRLSREDAESKPGAEKRPENAEK